jgi:hypothetical protein
LVFLVLLLVPGLAFAARHEKRTPRREHSAFREAGQVTVASLVCDAAVLTAFAVLATVLPRWVPDPAGLVQHPGSYAGTHYSSLGLWLLGLTLLAVALAAVLALNLPGLPGEIEYVSAWWEAFTSATAQTGPIYVGCTLTDDTYIGGELYRFSSDVHETADREIMLVGPIDVRPPGEGSVATSMEVGLVIASQLRYITVTYLDGSQATATAPGAVVLDATD